MNDPQKPGGFPLIDTTTASIGSGEIATPETAITTTDVHDGIIAPEDQST